MITKCNFNFLDPTTMNIIYRKQLLYFNALKQLTENVLENWYLFVLDIFVGPASLL